MLRSSSLGSSIFESFCATTPIILLFFSASFISLTERSLVTVIGIITPGNRTVFLKGNIGSVSGFFSLSIFCSSSSLKRGKNSLSPSAEVDKKISFISIFFIVQYFFWIS